MTVSQEAQERRRNRKVSQNEHGLKVRQTCEKCFRKAEYSTDFKSKVLHSATRENISVRFPELREKERRLENHSHLNTPKFPFSLFSGFHDFIETANPNPSTLLVSEGLITPSSHLVEKLLNRNSVKPSCDLGRKNLQSCRSESRRGFMFDLFLQFRSLCRIPTHPDQLVSKFSPPKRNGAGRKLGEEE